MTAGPRFLTSVLARRLAAKVGRGELDRKNSSGSYVWED